MSLEDFEILAKIGSGSFSQVYKVCPNVISLGSQNTRLNHLCYEEGPNESPQGKG